MVPLKPNELKRDGELRLAPRGSTLEGIWNSVHSTIEDKCVFSLNIKFRTLYVENDKLLV